MFGPLRTATRAAETENFRRRDTTCAARLERIESCDKTESCERRSRFETMILHFPRSAWRNGIWFRAQPSTITTGLTASDDTVKIVVLFVEILRH
jgi:hypothetical protein